MGNNRRSWKGIIRQFFFKLEAARMSQSMTEKKGLTTILTFLVSIKGLYIFCIGCLDHFGGYRFCMKEKRVQEILG